jgi:hypothetical protein
VRFQVLTAASMKFRFIFWDVLPCIIIVDRRFRGTCCLHHQGDRPLLFIILHGSTSQKTNLNFSLYRISLFELYVPRTVKRSLVCPNVETFGDPCATALNYCLYGQKHSLLSYYNLYELMYFYWTSDSPQHLSSAQLI